MLFRSALSLLMTRVWKIGRGSLVPVIWLHGIVNAIGSFAFDSDVWTNRWSEEFGIVLFALSALLAFAVLVKVTARKREPVAALA